ncbi:MAG TPA: regulatory protein RecX [Puia sp.]|nr:regulatory protein RecX [Puia sp.]
MIPQKKLSKEQALQKAKHFCAYQERNHMEVKQKLYSFGLWKKDVEEIVSTLIEENYLNEERYAIAFAGGKFRMKQWGKTKIKYELNKKKISPYCMKKAMKGINEEEYQQTFLKLAGKKWGSLKTEKNVFVKKRKTQDYLLQKGFEQELVSKFLANPVQNNA